MAQEQPKRQAKSREQEPIKYGDVFHVSGQVADKPVLPEDGFTMESAQKIVTGYSPIGGPASIMKSAAHVNIQPGLVDPNSSRTTEGIRVAESHVDGNRVVTESVNDEVVGQYVEPQFVGVPPEGATTTSNRGAVTIGETLEAVAHCAGDKPVDKADAAAIKAAEKKALGDNAIAPPGSGLGAEALNAAAWNAQAPRQEVMTTIDDLLKDASQKLAHDKAVTREDAKEVIKAEVTNDPEMATTIGGVGEMMNAASRLNQT